MTVQLIRMTAKDCAGAFYEMNRTERFRKVWPDQRAYIARCWPHFVVTARDALTALLTQTSTPEHMKTQIYEALIEDNRRRGATPLLLQANIHQTTLKEREEA